MRHLLLRRIEELKEKENGFSKKVMRWKNVEFGDPPKHISEVDFNLYRDEVLLFMFERIIRQYYKQM